MAALKKSFDKFGQKKEKKKTQQPFRYFINITTIINISFLYLYLYLQGMQNLTQHIHKGRISIFFSSMIFLNIEQKVIFLSSPLLQAKHLPVCSW